MSLQITQFLNFSSYLKLHLLKVEKYITQRFPFHLIVSGYRSRNTKNFRITSNFLSHADVSQMEIEIRHGCRDMEELQKRINIYPEFFVAKVLSNSYLAIYVGLPSCHFSYFSHTLQALGFMAMIVMHLFHQLISGSYTVG